MDNTQALQIVRALANGTHPTTGELFSADSPYQSPEIIRALYVACRALDAPASAGTRSTAGSNAESNNHRSTAQSRHPPAGNAGKPWSADEDKQLLAAFDAGKSIPELVQLHGRTSGGIRSRLEKHGRLEPSPASRWPVNGTSRSQLRDGAD